MFRLRFLKKTLPGIPSSTQSQSPRGRVSVAKNSYSTRPPSESRSPFGDVGPPGSGPPGSGQSYSSALSAAVIRIGIVYTTFIVALEVNPTIGNYVKTNAPNIYEFTRPSRELIGSIKGMVSSDDSKKDASASASAVSPSGEQQKKIKIKIKIAAKVAALLLPPVPLMG